ncbi:MAG: hypothetical protein QM725_01160 [Lacibacter sp.]
MINACLEKKLFCSFLFLVLASVSFAQQINGCWYSADRTRLYEIKKTSAHNYSAVIKSSSRTADSIGYEVIKDLVYNEKKQRYEGVMYAVSDGQPASVKITFDETNLNRIVLKLNRLFFMDVVLNWDKADD